MSSGAHDIQVREPEGPNERRSESCVRCGGGRSPGGDRGSIPTECPGELMVGHTLQAVLQGVVDYRDGRWQGYSGE